MAGLWVAGLCAILASAIFAAAAAFFSAVAAIFAAFAAFFSAAFFSFSAFCIFPSSVTLYTGLFSFGIPRNPSTREGTIITHVTKSIINRNIIAFIIPLSNMVVAIYKTLIQRKGNRQIKKGKQKRGNR